MPQPGRLLSDKYRIVRLIGMGGMGSVYEAEHTIIRRRCVIKFLHPAIAHEPDSVRRFIREAQAASAIGHPGIIDIYDVGVDADGSSYLVMEYLPGRSLGAILAAQGSLPVPQAVEIVVQALGALAVAHARGIVHRDLKPDNLFIRDVPGAPPATKILDFGVSHVKAAGGAEDRLTRTDSVLGTPRYMAPEQAGGSKDVDHRLDLYAMGVILYECVTGQPPYRADNYNRLLAMILLEPFRPPRELEPAIPAALEAAIMTAMARRREDRFGSADDMIRALAPFLSANARARLELPDAGAEPRMAATAAAFGLTRVCPKCGRRYAPSSTVCAVDAAPLASAALPPPSASAAPAAKGPVAAVLRQRHPRARRPRRRPWRRGSPRRCRAPPPAWTACRGRPRPARRPALRLPRPRLRRRIAAARRRPVHHGRVRRRPAPMSPTGPGGPGTRGSSSRSSRSRSSSSRSSWSGAPRGGTNPRCPPSAPPARTPGAPRGPCPPGPGNTRRPRQEAAAGRPSVPRAAVRRGTAARGIRARKVGTAKASPASATLARPGASASLPTADALPTACG